jgi:hypothetical protein
VCGAKSDGRDRHALLHCASGKAVSSAVAAVAAEEEEVAAAAIGVGAEAGAEVESGEEEEEGQKRCFNELNTPPSLDTGAGGATGGEERTGVGRLGRREKERDAVEMGLGSEAGSEDGGGDVADTAVEAEAEAEVAEEVEAEVVDTEAEVELELELEDGVGTEAAEASLGPALPSLPPLTAALALAAAALAASTAALSCAAVLFGSGQPDTQITTDIEGSALAAGADESLLVCFCLLSFGLSFCFSSASAVTLHSPNSVNPFSLSCIFIPTYPLPTAPKKRPEVVVVTNAEPAPAPSAAAPAPIAGAANPPVTASAMPPITAAAPTFSHFLPRDLVSPALTAAVAEATEEEEAAAEVRRDERYVM